jgi:hypothetical protein
MERIHHLLYFSSATHDFGTDELHSLLSVARRKNREKGVTGMLLYRGRTFLQMLEGAPPAVLGIYQRIQADPRHEGLRIVSEGPLQTRLFPTWSMGFLDADPAGIQAGRNRVLEEGWPLDVYNATFHPALRVMELFRVIR